jgi:hypothetical protein
MACLSRELKGVWNGQMTIKNEIINDLMKNKLENGSKKRMQFDKKRAIS